MGTSAAIVCAYCRAPNPTTRDHVPPLNLFPKPRPSNLITVPCCESCRRQQSMDDEYFRFMLVSGATTAEHPQAKMANEALRRSLRKPGKLGFARLVNQSLVRTDVVTPAGIYLGKAHGIRLEKKRITRVGERIVRGLFYHERGYPVPDGYEVMNTFRQGSFEDIVKTLGGVTFPPWKKFGSGVFAYTFRATEEDPDSMMWLQIFYEGLPFMGFTSKPESQRNVA